MKTMKENENNHNFYLKHDMLFLANVFEIFGNSSLRNNGLCPSHYFSAPALSQNAMLNMMQT